MSLLIDALKRAEIAKRGQTEPQLSESNTIERAVDAETNSGDWVLAPPDSEPVVGETAMQSPAATSRTEPKFFQPATESVAATSSTPPLVAPKAAAGFSKPDSQRQTKEREAAQTLFQAKRATSRSRAGMLVVGGIAALLLAAGGFYVWYSFAFPPSPAYQPVQARNPVSPAPVVPAPSAAIERVTQPTPVVSPEPTVSALADLKPEVDVAALSPGLIETAPKVKRPRRAAPQVSIAQAEGGASAEESSTEEIVRREIEQVQRSRRIGGGGRSKDDRGISVSRGDRGGRDFDPDLALAYNSLLSGQRAEAKRLYSIVSERDPFNVDALLGLATIAANQGDLDGAERYYRRALELEPQNPAVLAGLASIRQPGGPTESQIKFELARTPDSAQLHFALGNQFANQGRWDEAQQAYFDAFSLDSTNPDYVYNLAVSLDELGQTKQAMIYYRKALGIAKNRGARFRSTDVESRLTELAATP
jgi:tetratricopeptide (TPR) repeat protein